LKKKETETQKIMKDKKLMKLLRDARRKGSTSSPYTPLVKSTKREKQVKPACGKCGRIMQKKRLGGADPRLVWWCKEHKDQVLIRRF